VLSAQPVDATQALNLVRLGFENAKNRLFCAHNFLLQQRQQRGGEKLSNNLPRPDGTSPLPAAGVVSRRTTRLPCRALVTELLSKDEARRIGTNVVKLIWVSPQKRGRARP
jgi:hypothetical protein